MPLPPQHPCLSVLNLPEEDSLELVASEGGGEVGDLPGCGEGAHQAGVTGEQIDLVYAGGPLTLSAASPRPSASAPSAL
jgi:hypothetical protein